MYRFIYVGREDADNPPTITYQGHTFHLNGAPVEVSPDMVLELGQDERFRMVPRDEG